MIRHHRERERERERETERERESKQARESESEREYERLLADAKVAEFSIGLRISDSAGFKLHRFG